MLSRPCSTSCCHAGQGVRGRPDDMWGGLCFFLKKKTSAKVMKKFLQQTVKFIHKTGRKTWLNKGKNLACSFALEEKKVCF